MKYLKKFESEVYVQNSMFQTTLTDSEVYSSYSSDEIDYINTTKCIIDWSIFFDEESDQISSYRILVSKVDLELELTKFENHQDPENDETYKENLIETITSNIEIDSDSDELKIPIRPTNADLEIKNNRVSKIIVKFD